MRRMPAMIAAIAAAALVSAPAHAVLGGDAASIAADRAQAGANLVQTLPGALYTVYEMETPSGTAVREYVSRTGRVFAVAWSGPALPDLRQLLGAYFETYTEAAQAQQAGPGPMNVLTPGLVVQSGGRMRALFGRAYLPQLVPQGVGVDEIR